VLDVCRVRIGDYSLFGPAVQIYTPIHPFDAALRRRQEFGKPIDIGDDVWVGGGAMILPGVTIGARAVIGAGSVVTRDVPADVFAAGNPCRVIRRIDPGSQRPLVHEKTAGDVDKRAVDVGGRIGAEKDDD
jgi:maltose O-acetyltransferase